jgi:hypothetical protein
MVPGTAGGTSGKEKAMMNPHTTPAVKTGALSEIEPQAFADWVALARGEADAPVDCHNFLRKMNDLSNENPELNFAQLWAKAKKLYPTLISDFVRLRGHANQEGNGL